MHRPIPLLPTAALPAGTAAGLNDVFCSDCFAHAVAWAVENAKKGSVAKCSFQTQAGNMCIKKVSENRRLDGSR